MRAPRAYTATETRRALHPRARRTLALVASLVAAVATAAEPDAPALVIEPESGAVLHAEAADRAWFPASLTKMMTLYLAFDALERGDLALDEALPVSKAAAAQPAVRLGLKSGAAIAAADAIAAVATISSNDAAVVLAERLAGSEDAFAVRMTARARGLGMSRTTFRNASGLPDERQVTTARDMAILGRRLLLDFPDRFDAFSNRGVEFAGRSRTAHNRLLASYAGTDGIKTGFTCAAGYNIVATAERDGRRLLGVVLGGTSRYRRDLRVSALLDAAFARTPPPGGLPGVDDPVPSMPAAGSPPVRLASDACAKLVRKRKLVPGNLPGWGLLFGVFTDKGQGRTALREARKAIAKVAGRGIEVLLERKLERGASYKALLVGFAEDKAGKACKALWREQRTCIVQSPAMMNGRGYELR